MCLVALAIGQSERFPLVLTSNRDEFFDRPTAALDWWQPAPGDPAVLAGRDLQAGGSWLGLSATGRLALVTNVRDGLPQSAEAPSRGSLVTDWLLSSEPFETHWARLADAGHNGFNLVAADLDQDEWHWAGNRTVGGAISDGRTQIPRPLRLLTGLHGLSNAALDTPWPKVQRLKAAVQAALNTAAADRSSTAQDPPQSSLGQTFAAERGNGQGHDQGDDQGDGQASWASDDGVLDGLIEQLFAALGDNRTADDALLPATGLPLALERQLSAAFIRTPDGRYGTRCSTLVVTETTPSGRVTHVIERSFGACRDVDDAKGLARCVERRTRLAPGLAGWAAGREASHRNRPNGLPVSRVRSDGPAGGRTAEPLLAPITERVLPA
jgi:uncharacterized protein with NRDE domain